MRKQKWNFKVNGRTREQSRRGLALLAVFACGSALAEPPAASAPVAPATESAPPASATHADRRSDADARNDFEPRPFASGDVWLPPPQALRDFPATFSPVPDLHSRAYLDDLSIPTMGGDGHGIRDQSPTEQLIRQVKKEGMPLARLWQNDQALVSLGLNRKGKPGLWIIQKTR